MNIINNEFEYFLLKYLIIMPVKKIIRIYLLKISIKRKLNQYTTLESVYVYYKLYLNNCFRL